MYCSIDTVFVSVFLNIKDGTAEVTRKLKNDLVRCCLDACK